MTIKRTLVNLAVIPLAIAGIVALTGCSRNPTPCITKHGTDDFNYNKCIKDKENKRTQEYSKEVYGAITQISYVSKENFA